MRVYLSNEPWSEFICYDNANVGGDGAGDAGGAAGGDVGATNGAAGGDAGAGEPTVPQSKFNAEMAKEKAKFQSQLKSMESRLQELSNSNSMTEQERTKLAEVLDDVKRASMTKEQALQREKKQLQDSLTKEIETLKTEKEILQQRYVKEMTARDILEAAAPEAFNPRQVVSLLMPLARMREEVDANGKPTGVFQTVIDLDDVDEKGQPIKSLLTPTEAIARMKEKTSEWGNLFRSNVVHGVGGNPAQGAGGKIDYKTMTPEQYMDIRKKNPEALGLRKK